MTERKTQSFTDFKQIQCSQMEFVSHDKTQESLNQNNNYEDSRFQQQNYCPFDNQKEGIKQKFASPGKTINQNNYNVEGHFYCTNNRDCNMEEQFNNQIKNNIRSSFNIDEESNSQIKYDQYNRIEYNNEQNNIWLLQNQISQREKVDNHFNIYVDDNLKNPQQFTDLQVSQQLLFERDDHNLSILRVQSENKSLLIDQDYQDDQDIENLLIQPQAFTEQYQFEEHLNDKKDYCENNQNFMKQNSWLKSNQATHKQQNQQNEQKIFTPFYQTLNEISQTQCKLKFKEEKHFDQDGKKSQKILDKKQISKSQQDLQNLKRKSKHFQIIKKIKQQSCLEIEYKLLHEFKNNIKRNLIRDMLKRCNRNINQQLLKLYLSQSQMDNQIFDIYQRIDNIYQQLFINHQNLSNLYLKKNILIAYVQLYNENRNQFCDKKVKYLFQSTDENLEEQKKEIDLVSVRIKNKSTDYIILLIEYSKLIFKEFFNHFTENQFVPYLFSEYKQNKYPQKKYKDLKFKQLSIQFILQFYEILFINNMQKN
ncbi:hypothetical protein ABPG72_015944 [Tetrahymena utriculariae]